MIFSRVARVNLLEGTKIVAYPEVLQLFNDEIYPVRISVRKSLIKVAIYEIYGIRLGGPCPPPATPMMVLYTQCLSRKRRRN